MNRISMLTFPRSRHSRIKTGRLKLLIYKLCDSVPAFPPTLKGRYAPGMHTSTPKKSRERSLVIGAA